MSDREAWDWEMGWPDEDISRDFPSLTQQAIDEIAGLAPFLVLAPDLS